MFRRINRQCEKMEGPPPLKPHTLLRRIAIIGYPPEEYEKAPFFWHDLLGNLAIPNIVSSIRTTLVVASGTRTSPSFQETSMLTLRCNFQYKKISYTRKTTHEMILKTIVFYVRAWCFFRARKLPDNNSGGFVYGGRKVSGRSR